MRILLMVDVQNDFITGSLGSPDAERILPFICKKVEGFISRYPKGFIYTMDTHDKNYHLTSEGKFLPTKHCIVDTDGWKLPDKLENIVLSDNEAVMLKKYTFASSDLPHIVNSVLIKNNSVLESIEIIGLCTDVCVISNALLLKAFFPETDIIVDSSCCAGTSPESHERALKVMEMCNIIVNVKK